MYMSTKQIGVPSMYGGVPTGKYGRVRKRRHGREQSEEGMKIPPLVEANGGGGQMSQRGPPPGQQIYTNTNQQRRFRPSVSKDTSVRC